MNWIKNIFGKTASTSKSGYSAPPLSEKISMVYPSIEVIHPRGQPFEVIPLSIMKSASDEAREERREDIRAVLKDVGVPMTSTVQMSFEWIPLRLRPMTSAPRDGTFILCRSKEGGDAVIVTWSDTLGGEWIQLHADTGSPAYPSWKDEDLNGWSTIPEFADEVSERGDEQEDKPKPFAFHIPIGGHYELSDADPAGYVSDIGADKLRRGEPARHWATVRVDKTDDFCVPVSFVPLASPDEQVGRPADDGTPDALKVLKQVYDWISDGDWWMTHPNRGGFDIGIIEAAIEKAEKGQHTPTPKKRN